MTWWAIVLLVWFFFGLGYYRGRASMLKEANQRISEIREADWRLRSTVAPTGLRCEGPLEEEPPEHLPAPEDFPFYADDIQKQLIEKVAPGGVAPESLRCGVCRRKPGEVYEQCRWARGHLGPHEFVPIPGSKRCPSRWQWQDETHQERLALCLLADGHAGDCVFSEQPTEAAPERPPEPRPKLEEPQRERLDAPSPRRDISQGLKEDPVRSG